MNNSTIHSSKSTYRILVLVLVSFIAVFANAQPHWGGEITFETLNTGKVRFILKYYRNCQATFQIADSIILNSNSPVTSILLHKAAGYPKDISPTCDGSTSLPHISCNSYSTNPNGSVQEFVFTSDVAYPNGVAISGNPPSSGWEFWYSSQGFRPNSVNVISISGLYLRCKIFSFNNTLIINEHSPSFESSIYNIIPAGYLFNYHPRGNDPDLDSIAYSWGELKDSYGTNANFNSGYSNLNPLPGTNQNPANIAATMHPTTGEISFKSCNTGIYYATQKATSFRCGIKIAEIYRDMVFYIVDSSYNQLPLFINNTGNLTDTFYTGENIHIDFALIDYQLQTNSDTQEVSFELYGAQFGSYVPGTATILPTLSKTTGCNNPPCATITPASVNTNPIFSKSSFLFSFDWQTDCCSDVLNLGCGKTTNKFDFIFKITDNFCPVPAYTYKTYSIVLERMPWIDYPEINQISYDSGKILLRWDPVIDSLNIFKEYQAYKYDTLAFSGNCFDTTTSLSTQYHFPSSYIKSECFYIFPRGKGYTYLDTAKFALALYNSIFLNIKTTPSSHTVLEWNPIQSWKTLQANQHYRIYRKTQSNSTWQLIDSTQSTTWTEKSSFCNDSVRYKIGFKIITKNGVSNHESFSNAPQTIIKDVSAPSICHVRSVAIDNVTGHAAVTFEKSHDADFKQYIIYKINYWGGFSPHDTIYTQTDTLYIDTTSTLTNLADSSFYKVSVVDICLNQSALGGYLGLKTLIRKNDISIFPNPASDIIKVVIDNQYDIHNEIRAEVFNCFGQLILTHSFSPGLKAYELNVKELREGLYTLKLKFDNQFTASSRFIVHRTE